MSLKRLLRIGVYLFVFFVPLIPFKTKISIIPLSADFLIIAYMAFIILLMVFNVDKRKMLFDGLKGFSNTRLFFWVIIYSAVCLFSLIPALSKTAAITELLRFWTYIFMFFVIMTFIDTQEQIKNIVKISMLSVLFVGIMGLVQYIAGDSTFPNPESIGPIGRVYSTFVNPNFFGAFINIVIFPALVLVKRKVKHYKYIYVIIFLLLLNLIFTYTRGSWLGFAIGLMIFIAFFSKKFLIPISIIAPLSLFIPGIWERITSIFDPNSWTIIERYKLWKTGYLMFKEHPILGVGNGNYLTRYGEYIKKYTELDLGRDQYAVHNTFIKVLAETGILGLIPFIMVIIYFIKEIFLVFRKSADSLSKDISLAFMCSIVSYLIQNISNEMFFIPQVHVFYWIFGALIIKYSKLCNVSFESGREEYRIERTISIYR